MIRIATNTATEHSYLFVSFVKIRILVSIFGIFIPKVYNADMNQEDKDKLEHAIHAATPIALSKEELLKHINTRIENIAEEFKRGFELLTGMERTVTFFGSARFTEDNDHYQMARKIAGRLASYGIGVVTGGGGGIMEAANRGAYESKGYSLGLNIKLPHEQKENPYLTESTLFKYFFVRKVLLSYAAEAYLFFPGGFGTLDELFEIITLVQTHKIEPVPIILVGNGYWKKMSNFIEKEMYKKHHAISKEDMKLYTITDDVDTIVDIVLHAPIREQD